ncbi:anthranilate synthase component I [Gammaproteobacteria bacterium LSUCC0112]|nr:anthranilate synthase component I [Gammaproteobacteria bacterium LSUCC0112]
MSVPSYCRYTSAGGVSITRQSRVCDGAGELLKRLPLLDTQPGVLLSCASEFPGRYQKRDLLLVNPPIQLGARHHQLNIRALNARGEILLPTFYAALQAMTQVELQLSDRVIVAELRVPPSATSLLGDHDAEEMRTRRPGLFDMLRALIAYFSSDEDHILGLYGAFAYDLAFQLEAITLHLPRSDQQRDLVLYLPDEILLHDPRTGAGTLHSYDFVCADQHGRLQTTGGLKRLVNTEQHDEFRFVQDKHANNGHASVEAVSDHAPGEYAAVVKKARDYFARGDLFEAVPGQTFSMPSNALPSVLFQRLKDSNPAPYGALINLGQQEFLISASPEMFVRVKSGRVESCPISGTILRGADALADAAHIRELLNSEKDEAELSMCTDVDRNDKSRVCVPGSVKIIGRRQVELYSRLIHTVDHVEGKLQQPFDALDAFLTHTWAVTVTGAPKLRAMQFIEHHEKTARGWYGGAFGCLGFDGSLDTGLTLRTMHLHKHTARVRVGATLLMDSDPIAEEAETRLKASALLDVLKAANSHLAANKNSLVDRTSGASAVVTLRRVALTESSTPEKPLRALMIDHQDSFVLTLASAFRAQGVQLQTLRPSAAQQLLRQCQGDKLPDLVILSPGPGRPQDFDCAATLALCEQFSMPVFGVCLGLQAMVEFAGGKLAVLEQPVHGKPGLIAHQGHALFEGLPQAFKAGRYHSLHASKVPECLAIIAQTELPEPCVMAVTHKVLPWMGVQFHPESLMTMESRVGDRLIANVVDIVRDYAKTKTISAANDVPELHSATSAMRCTHKTEYEAHRHVTARQRP